MARSGPSGWSGDRRAGAYRVRRYYCRDRCRPPPADRGRDRLARQSLAYPPTLHVRRLHTQYRRGDPIMPGSWPARAEVAGQSLSLRQVTGSPVYVAGAALAPRFSPTHHLRLCLQAGDLRSWSSRLRSDRCSRPRARVCSARRWISGSRCGSVSGGMGIWFWDRGCSWLAGTPIPSTHPARLSSITRCPPAYVAARSHRSSLSMYVGGHRRIWAD